ncbi:MAG: hypothetical protein ACYTE5_08040 [Planctomycetota bacterium]|jgi:hypothetical protein
MAGSSRKLIVSFVVLLCLSDSPMFKRGFKQIGTARIDLLPDFPGKWRS